MKILVTPARIEPEQFEAVTRKPQEPKNKQIRLTIAAKDLVIVYQGCAIARR